MYVSKHEAHLLVQDQEELLDLLCTCCKCPLRGGAVSPRNNFGSPLSAHVI